ncbi:hypothetical protein CHS0354_031546 [Potamilus streckersoni]|uniref:Uncharacterized protein n=1 Tax=Potamilus streckersoni TaxID=2493646 RepID=A0AAE0SZ99_9BIVA|nr:hypothetical protein CHS0354_031546 [Potamilus streckersoni]
MTNIETNYPGEYEGSLKANNAVQYSGVFPGDISTYLMSEQVLMCSIKTIGGHTRGRGMSVRRRQVWVSSITACTEINHSMREFAGSIFQSNGHHKETSNAKKEKTTRHSKPEFYIIVGRNKNTDMEKLFKDELCSYPVTLFESSYVLRKAKKRVLANAMWNEMQYT